MGELDSGLPEDIDHIYSGTHEDAADYYLKLALARAGLASGVTSAEEEEEERKKNDEYNKEADRAVIHLICGNLSRLKADYDALAEEIKNLLFRQTEIEDQIKATETEEAETAEVLALKEKEEEEQERHATAADAQVTESEHKFTSLKLRLAEIGLPPNVLTAYYRENPDTPSFYAIKVAVSYDASTGLYSYMLANGQKIAVTDANTIHDLHAQRTAPDPANRKISADQLPESDQGKIRTYTTRVAACLEAARILDRVSTARDDIRSRLEDLREDIREHRQHLNELADRKKELGRHLQEIKKQIAQKTERAQELQTEIRRIEAEMKEITQEKRGAVQKFAQNGTREQVRELEKQMDEINAAYHRAYRDVELQFESAFDQFEKADKRYSEANKILEDNNVIMVTRDFGNVHLKFAVHSDEKGLFYIDPDGKRMTVSPREIAFLRENGGKTVEELSHNVAVRAAAMIAASATKGMSDAANVMANTEPGGAVGRAMSASAMEALTAKSMIAPPSERQAQYDTVEERLRSVIDNGKVTRWELNRALESASAEYRAQIEAEILERHELTIEEPRRRYIFRGMEDQVQIIDPFNPAGVHIISHTPFSTAQIIDPLTMSTTPEFNQKSDQPPSATIEAPALNTSSPKNDLPMKSG